MTKSHHQGKTTSETSKTIRVNADYNVIPHSSNPGN